MSVDHLRDCEAHYAASEHFNVTQKVIQHLLANPESVGALNPFHGAVVHDEEFAVVIFAQAPLPVNDVISDFDNFLHRLIEAICITLVFGDLGIQRAHAATPKLKFLSKCVRRGIG